jgi:hypothetical protein
MVFEGCFQNTNEDQMMIRMSNEVGYRLWLQGLLNHLGTEWHANYIVAIFCKILEFSINHLV